MLFLGWCAETPNAVQSNLSVRVRPDHLEPNRSLGDTGNKGDTGETGAAGPSAAYTNYVGDEISLASGTTQTVASVTVPAGTYVLSGVVSANNVDNLEFAQCFFVAAGTVHGRLAALIETSTQPILGDVTLSSTSNPIFLRCSAHGGALGVAGGMIATMVGSATASE